MDEKQINSELNALINLLDEPDEFVFDKVKERFFSYGLEAVPLLEDVWDLSYEHTQVQKRIEGIIHEIQFNNVIKLLSQWKEKAEPDLLAGAMIIAKYHYPEMKDKVVIDKIGRIIQDVWLELNDNLTFLEKIKILNHIIFDIHGFKPNKLDLFAPSTSYINLMVESKMGNYESLGILYLIVAQSHNIPLYGVDLPRQLIMACTDKLIRPGDPADKHDVLFYLTAHHTGIVFTRREVEKFIEQMNLETKPSYFLPCDNITVIRRLINYLILSYEKRGMMDKIEDLKKLKQVLE